ncbi:Rne/Rng family ribonuclease [[Mycobacterium] holstebronense]|uniref:Rne/Rng family ribonuclease n=1 Tax=[Mycobacterium] holstebronense TaxID=3064288 RepID=A0ABN9NA89_9MYCO|nr:Rne/Rng family ribonuclease [Mycolicibacter sp. MU0102]CAJ1501336.1 Rne/Rng family ribonuclease [Mycolicibacter sp. MU0102]
MPDRLRVHSLARVLGTTSRRVLDALTELDGRARSAHSSVDRVEAVRVRDLLDSFAEPAVTGLFQEAGEAEVAGEVPDEPESRLLLETAPEPTAVRADYMPLFVAPQPVAFERPVPRDVPADKDDDSDDYDDEDLGGSDADADTDDENGDRPANRRRRRGRRGRGRGRGSEGAVAEDGDDETEDDDSGAESEEAGDAEDAADDEGGSADDAGNRRRRRRRRRKAGAGEEEDAGSSDDPPNTVVHERAPRAKTSRSAKSDRGTGDDEIQGITGSTRLEAKRQRRRDGRDAGRRRPPILSEAEFLARREAVVRRMVVRDRVRTEPPHQGARYTQIAVLEDGVMVEHFVTSAASTSLVGNVYLGIVQNVLPSMEAAFVDIGRGRNGVLYAGEVNWEAAGLGGANRKIEQALKPGDYVVVQVSKDPIGHKGARLTTQVSLAGRYLVYVPGASSTGISRKLPDTERQRLKEILREVVPADAGVIIRTASEGVKESDIRSDVERLQERWTQIEATAAETKGKAAGAAVALYEEPDVLVKVIRDLFNEDFSELVVSGDDAWATINDYVGSVAPELVSKLTRYQAPSGPEGQTGPDVFAVHRIDEQLAKALDRKVWLPSGGTLVIDRTEAMTVVDVNTGKFTGSGGNLEETVTKNNLEAAEEIVRQLRLRDIGGIIVIDFIDMVLESNRDLVLRRLTEALGRDRTRHQVSEVTSLGLVQLTRKRLGTGLIEAFSTSCQHCAGRGIVLHADPVDSAAPGRKTESGGSGSTSSSRRSKRSKKPKVDEPPVTKVPVHTPGDHPMFKAMAAATDRHDESDDEHETVPDADELLVDLTEEGAEGTEEAEGGDVAQEAPESDVADEDLAEDDADDDDADDDDADDDDEDVDEVDLDEDEDEDADEVDLDDDDDEDFDDDLDVIDESDESDDDSDDAEDAEDFDEPEVEVAVAERPRRRRAAARPAGPPI